jgi:UDP-4-amino-4,6-dideoxy-N-acetyl-beta-L-altrosamine N-acetyltransferase
MPSSQAKSITLIPIRQLDLATQHAIRLIRNEESVRQWMYTDHEISEREHTEWLNRLDTDNRQLVFAVVSSESHPVGVVSLNSIDRKHQKSDWAYYLTNDVRGGLGAVIEFHFLSWAMADFDLQKLNCEVLEGNDAVVKLHEKFGFRKEGFRRHQILKSGSRLGVHLLGITRKEWEANQSQVYARYQKIFDMYELELTWP